jgi:drug/metabolite transporter (DMT)-like permease
LQYWIGFSILSILNQKYEINAFDIPLQFWLLAIISGIMQYALGFLLYLISLNELNVSSAAFYIALVPVFSVASAIILIGEQPNNLQWIGAALVLTSSYFANKLRTA